MNKIVCTVLAAAVTAFLTVGCGEKENLPIHPEARQ